MKYFLVTAIATLFMAQGAAASDVGKSFPSEKQAMIDRITGTPLVVLTNGPGDSRNYQTHPQWAQDGRHIIFRSSGRAADGNPQAYAVDEITGEIVQLTDGPGVNTGSLNVARRSNKLYYTRKTDGRASLIELDLAALFADVAAKTVKDTGYERVVGVLPADHRDSGGFTMDADEKTAYFGVSLQEAPPRPAGKPVPQVPGGIRAMDIATGSYRKVIDVPFRMGHVQANPWVPGEILYCHETGGDAPQRMFIVRADGSGNRPLYVENPADWVTHEVFVDADHVIFNLMGHTAALRQHPSGIMAINLRNGTMENIGQTEAARSFWHSNGSSDGHWAVGDDFDGNVTLIDRRTGKRTVLTSGHMMKPDHTHPSFSPDGRRILIQSGLLSSGRKLDLMTIAIPGNTELGTAALDPAKTK